MKVNIWFVLAYPNRDGNAKSIFYQKVLLIIIQIIKEYKEIKKSQQQDKATITPLNDRWIMNTSKIIID